MPLCFMVMPFGVKSTLAEANQAPALIDFNRLWDLAYVPVIKELGYDAVRADQDTGSLIVTEMLERLYFADLVLADMTIPNGNVYYEIGIRHAAKKDGCVLLAADWSRPLFDVAQMRTVRYPLPEGEITEATVEGVQKAIRDKIGPMVKGASPMYDAIAGYSDRVEPERARTMQGELARQAAFQGRLRAVRAAPRAERMQRAGDFAATLDPAAMTAHMAIAVLLMLRDCADSRADWTHALDFVRQLPADLRNVHEIQEQHALAMSHAGQHEGAIAELDGLIRTSGPTPERLGLLGGRYKRLYNAAVEAGGDAVDRRRFLRQAIACYEQGMDLDLNEYYCSSNLPRLYRARGGKDDEDRAQTVLRVVIAACDRALRRRSTDAWLRPTLLVAAFDAGDADKAEALADQFEIDADAGERARWQVDSVRADLKTSLQHVKDAVVRGRLEAVMARFGA